MSSSKEKKSPKKRTFKVGPGPEPSSSSASAAASSSSANKSEAELNAELAGYWDDFLKKNATASAAATSSKSFEKILADLEKTSKEVASLSAAATRSPSPSSFAKIEARLAAASAAAADLTLIASTKNKLSSDYHLARSILKDIFDLSPSARCGVMTSFLTTIHTTVLKVSGSSGKYSGGTTRKLLDFIDASKSTSCAHHHTDKEFLSYLINVMKTLFDKDFFNEGTIDRSGKHQLEALYNHFWEETTKTGMGKAFVKRGGSYTKRRRRCSRTRKI